MYYYKLTVAYDGTNYCGWQVQINSQTVQGVMMQAAIDLFGASVTLTGASRTDTGVHAEGQVVLLVGERQIEAYKLPLALNGRLPKDIVVMEAEVVDETFHPRYNEHIKTYDYLIYNRARHLPRLQRYSLHYRHKLDLEKMREAAHDLVGTHDFTSFASKGGKITDGVRTIFSIEVSQEDYLIRIRLIGDGFLYNMIRIIVGTLLEVGNGKRSLNSVSESLRKKDRATTGQTAAAKGLTLKEIHYKDKGKNIK